jgi:hypothetical protein
VVVPDGIDIGVAVAEVAERYSDSAVNAVMVMAGDPADVVVVVEAVAVAVSVHDIPARYVAAVPLVIMALAAV